MRFAYALFALVFSTLSASAQQAQGVGVEMTWFGAYQVTEVKVVDDPKTAAGKSYVGGKIIPPPVNSERIPFTGGYFGFGYKLLGSPHGAAVPLRYVRLYPPPGLPNSATGVPVMREEQELSLAIGRDDLFIGFHALPNAPMGPWTFQVWYGSRLLAEKTLILYKP